MGLPTIRNYFRNFFRHLPGVMQASFVDSKSDFSSTADAAGHQDESPFVLVAHGAGGQWEVYARDFEHPLATFEDRQSGCDYANTLAKYRKDSIILIRESRTLG